MSEYKQFNFSVTVVHPNTFRLRVIRVFSDVRFLQNRLLTELNSTISGVHFSVATIFHYLNFVQFCSNSTLKLSHRFSSQWLKPVVDISSSPRNRDAIIGDYLKEALICG